MNKLLISRTQALKNFRDKIGTPVRNLNTVIVGLSAVAAGTAHKPSDLSVSWDPKDLQRSALEARGFSIRSLMVTACDALDHYLEDLGELPSPIDDEKLRSTLRREPQTYTQPAKKLNEAALASFSSELLEFKDNPQELKKKLAAFTLTYCGKQKVPSIRRRHSALFDYCAGLPPNPTTLPQVPKHSYFAAVELLIAWRNVLVHDSDKDELGSNAIAVLQADAAALKQDHAAVSIQETIDRYTDKKEPTLKDISTLVSILLRYVAAIDAVLISRCDVSRYVRTSLAFEIKARASGMETLRRLSGRTWQARIEAAGKLVAPHGFTPDNFATKQGAYSGRTLSSSDFNFLNETGMQALAQSIGVAIKK